MAADRRADGGVTLIELLVSMAVLGVLLALTVSAVGSSRATARRLTCANNLRQIGIALHAHHEQKEAFPPGGVEWRAAGDMRRRQLAWSVFLLPFLDQQNLFDQLDLRQAFDSAANAAAASEILPVFICPANGRGAHLVQGRGPCDYGGIYGERISGPNQPPKGLMIYDRAFRDSEVKDGLSSTLIVAEDSMWPDGQWINGRNLFDQAFAINRAPAFENDIRSEHGGGAHGLLANGTARFLDEATELKVLAALCTREGREVISAGSY